MPELKKQTLRDAYVYCESKSWIEKSLNFVDRLLTLHISTSINANHSLLLFILFLLFPPPS